MTKPIEDTNNAAAIRTALDVPTTGALNTVGDAAQAAAETAAAKYTKPSTGIPASDLAAAAQTSLGKADSAIQDLAGMTAKFNAGTAPEKAAFQSSVSGDAALMSSKIAASADTKTYSLRNSIGSGALDNIRADLAIGTGSIATVIVQGDSTGNAADEWVMLSTARIAAEYPAAHVRYALWNDATQEYDAPVVVQDPAPGCAHAFFESPTLSRTFYTPASEIPAVTGDIDVRARVYIPSQPTATAGIACRYGGAGARSWKMSINTGGQIDWTWTADGTTNIVKVTMAAGLPFGTDFWVRCTLDVDNGSGGHTWTAYKSTDGVTWTSVGSSVTTAGTTSIYDGTYEYEIGGRGFSAEPLPALSRIYEVQIRQGIGGPIVNPQPITTWRARAASGAYISGEFRGSPTLYVLNGSHPGSSTSYHTDTARHKLMVRPYCGATLIQSMSHNDAELLGAAHETARSAWATQSYARCPGSSLSVIIQNPSIDPLPRGTQFLGRQRRRELRNMCRKYGWRMIDVERGFTENPGGPAALLLSDGLHPTTGDTPGTGTRVFIDAVCG